MKKSFLLSILFIALSACNSKSPIVNLVVKDPLLRHTEPQLNYLNSENYNDTTPYNGNMSVSNPLPISFSWEVTNDLKEFDINFYYKNNHQLAVSYHVNDTKFDFYNSEVNQTYLVNVSNGNKKSNELEFVTGNKGPRNLFIDGVENFRDLGGWGIIKQGLIYRSGRFNEDKIEEVNVTIKDDGIYEINNHLKIKTEIDLRRTSVNEVGGLTNKSVLGDNVTYIQLPMYYGGNNILTFTGKASKDDYEYDNPKAIKEFFNILAKESSYPLNFHCSIGKDRTGCLAYLVEALLGFNEETLIRDYMFTNFANAGMCKVSDINDRYGKTINEYRGDTLKDKTFNYLNEVVGVEASTLNKVIEILKA